MDISKLINNFEQENKILKYEMKQINKKIERISKDNTRLQDQIRKCNKEVLKQREIIDRKPSLLKDILIRQTISKMKKK